MCFLLISLFKIDPKHSAEVLFSDANYKKAVMCLHVRCKRKYMLEELCSDSSYSTFGHEFNVNESQYILNKVSLNRNTENTVCIDQLIKM